MKLLLQLVAEHKVHPEGIEYVEVADDQAAMQRWVGQSAYGSLPIRWTSGSPRLASVGIKTSGATIILR